MNTSPHHHQKLWYLKNYDLFADIPESDIQAIAGNVMMKECGMKTLIYAPDDPSDAIYIVKKGEVVLYHEKDGKRLVFDTLGPGSLFGGIAPNETQYGHYAESGNSCCVCLFPRETFLQLISAYPDVMLKFMQYITERLQEYQLEFQKYSAKADELVLHELVRLNAKRQQTFVGKLLNRPLRVTHEEIADLTGLNRVTVTRAMKSLRESAAIGYDPQTGIITIHMV